MAQKKTSSVIPKGIDAQGKQILIPTELYYLKGYGLTDEGSVSEVFKNEILNKLKHLNLRKKNHISFDQALFLSTSCILMAIDAAISGRYISMVVMLLMALWVFRLV